MTKLAFQSRMDRLAGLKFAPANLDTHWSALADIGEVELDAAIERAVRECDEFPSPRMLRAFIDDHRRDQPVPKEVDRSSPSKPRTITTPWGTSHTFSREWRYYCEECCDTGVRSWWCGESPSKRFPHLDVVRCANDKCLKLRTQHGGYEHEYVSPCPCAETNPDVLRKKAQASQVIRKEANR